MVLFYQQAMSMANFTELPRDLYLSHPSVQPPARATSLTPSSDTSAPPAPRPCALSVRNRQGFEHFSNKTCQ